MHKLLKEVLDRGLLDQFRPDDCHLPFLLRAVAFLRKGAVNAAVRDLQEVPKWRLAELNLVRSLVAPELLLNALAEVYHNSFVSNRRELTFFWGALLGERISEVYDYYEQTDEFYTRVVGLGYENRAAYLKSLHPGNTVFLIREPDNPYDENAITVVTPKGEMLGYLRRTLAEILAPQMDRGLELNASVAFVYEECPYVDERLYLKVKKAAG